MATMKKFPSIGQYREVIKSVRDFCKKHGKPLPTLKFTGTVKLHGTNAAICYSDITNEFWCQSRERIITPFSDNMGFAKYAYANKDAYTEFLKRFCGDNGMIALYGEWAGPGVFNNVAIGQLPQKQFFAFDMVRFDNDANGEEVQERVEIEHFGDFLNMPLASSITNYPTYEVEIDFNRPELAQNHLVDLTVAVEERCPVAAQLGFDGMGEGIVWFNPETGLRFKVKGEKHSTSKVKTVKQIAAVDLERMATIEAFVDTVVTENRLNQGIAKLGEMGKPVAITSMGDFIKWVGSDVLKEEMDLIEASNIEKKDLMGKMAQKSKTFFLNHINKEVGLAA